MMSKNPKEGCTPQPPETCTVPAVEQIPVSNQAIPTVSHQRFPTLKVPVVLAERTLQIVVEADTPLSPAATEIKRVHKNVFLNQVKLVPVAFTPIEGTNFFNVTRAKLFVSGFIRKNIEYASGTCNGNLYDRIAEVAFAGFTELTHGDFKMFPILAQATPKAASMFINEKNQSSPRLDKWFFQNHVQYNEQPYGELLGADFYELDFSPVKVGPGQSFKTLREKIVMDLSIKLLQVQQIQVTGNQIVPSTAHNDGCHPSGESHC